MKLPFIHTNGTTASELFRDWRRVYETAQELEAALRAAAPHGRDYYPSGAGAYQEARAEHAYRQRQAEQITRDAEAILTHLMEHEALAKPVRQAANAAIATSRPNALKSAYSNLG